jgi:hypothetical protein
VTEPRSTQLVTFRAAAFVCAPLASQHMTRGRDGA